MHAAQPDRSCPRRMSAAEFRALATGRKAPAGGRAKHRSWRDKPRDVTGLPWRLVLPFLPPSVNRLFHTVRDERTGVTKRVLTTEARRIRRLVVAMTSAQLDPDALYELRLAVHLKAFTRDGEVRRVDLSNRVKFIEDCVCLALGIDDSRIFRVVLEKHDAESDRTVIELHPYAQPDTGREAA